MHTKTVDDWWDARKRMKGSRKRNREQSSCRGFNEFWSRFVCLANSLWSFACVYLWMIGLIRMQTQATDTTIICRIKHATRWILYRKLANSAALCAGTLVIIEWMVDWDIWDLYSNPVTVSIKVRRRQLVAANCSGFVEETISTYFD